MNFIALLKSFHVFLQVLLKKIPGLFFKALIHRPESSEITGKFTCLAKKFAFNFEFASNVLPVSLGLLILREAGEIF